MMTSLTEDSPVGDRDGLGPESEAMISIVVPLYNEEESVPVLHEELKRAIGRLGRPYELVFVNDGSTDQTEAIVDRLVQDDPRASVIHFRRNYGQTAAMAAGIDHARGAIIIPMDGDLQNDPADIPALVARLEEGFDVVSGWRKDRQDKALSRRLPSRCANWLISWISGVRLHDYGCTLKAYRREVIADVRLYGEMHRFIPIYANMQGGRVTEMVVHHRPRRFGRSKYGLNRVFKVVLDLLLVKFLASYAAKPIYVFGGFGLACLAGSLAPILMALYFKFTPVAAHHKDLVETPLPLIAVAMILVGVLALLQGLLAEMLMRTYFESQGKRTYVVKRVRSGPRDEPTQGRGADD